MTWAIDTTAELEALATLGGLSGARVLEVGCREGRLTREYAADTHSVLAIDPDSRAIRKARASLPAELRARVRFSARDVVELRGPPAAFDAVFLTHSL